ncbi:MAG: energy transducer TonB, partial [Bacteroidales bacterium]|nr:energy transducer TonB [Bacteroidales bacterium]
MENKKLIFILIFLGSFASVCAQGQLVNNGYEKGYVKNGFKSGLWQYYDSTGILELEIDYTSSTLKYIIPDTSEYIIFENGEWVKSKLDIPPRYIGSSKEFYNILKENVDYPMQARYRDIIGVVWISFEVDTSGKAGNYQIHNEIGGECGYEFLRVLKLIPNYW